jgi:hypothetical protein
VFFLYFLFHAFCNVHVLVLYLCICTVLYCGYSCTLSLKTLPPGISPIAVNNIYKYIMSSIQTYLLTELNPSWGAANCAAPQELPSVYGTRRFNTVFTRALHWSLSWAVYKHNLSEVKDVLLSARNKKEFRARLRVFDISTVPNNKLSCVDCKQAVNQTLDSHFECQWTIRSATSYHYVSFRKRLSSFQGDPSRIRFLSTEVTGSGPAEPFTFQTNSRCSLSVEQHSWIPDNTCANC